MSATASARALLCCALGACGPAEQPSASRAGSAPAPHNVVVIVMDDVGPELLGVYDRLFTAQGKPSGHPAATPAIDALLAGRGLVFTRAWSNPSCSPTRAGILTGRHSRRNGIGSVTAARALPGGTGLTAGATLLPELLRGAAQPYSSVALGKWHLADKLQLDSEPTHPLGNPPGRWFERWAGTNFVAATPDGLSESEFGYRFWKKSYASALVDGANPCAPGAPPCSVQITSPPLENYATVDTADDALAVLAELREPFFLYVGFNACHKPLHDVPDGLPQPDCAGYVAPGPCVNPGLPPDPARARCMMQALDAQIGRLLCAIDASDTTVVLLGDNGTAREATLAPYEPRHAKGSLYEGGIHVPLIVRSPLLDPALVGGTCAELVHTTDVFASVCQLAGVDAGPGVDSVSFVPYLRGPSAPQRATLYSESFAPNFVPDARGAAPADYVGEEHEQALFDGRFKLIRRTWRDGTNGAVRAREELYDLLQGAPGTSPDAPGRPDFFEEHELLARDELEPSASAALSALRGTLDSEFPPLVR